MNPRDYIDDFEQQLANIKPSTPKSRNDVQYQLDERRAEIKRLRDEVDNMPETVAKAISAHLTGRLP